MVEGYAVVSLEQPEQVRREREEERERLAKEALDIAQKKFTVIKTSKLNKLQAELKKHEKEGYIYVKKKKHDELVNELEKLEDRLRKLNLLANESNTAEHFACTKEEFRVVLRKKMLHILNKYERKRYDEYLHRDVMCIPPSQYQQLRDELFPAGTEVL